MRAKNALPLALFIAVTGCNIITGASDLMVLGSGGAGGEGGATTSAVTSSTTNSGTTSSSTATTSSATTSTTTSAATTSSTGSGSTDPYEADRQACVDKINALRATKGLSPYTRWQSSESCVDKQATHDESVMKPHDAFSTGNPSCGGNGQNECPGWGASSITDCLQQMWDERLQAGCSGCDACDTFTIFGGNCPNCSFNGSVVCGHYVNMSSKTFGMAACGFATDGKYEAINFQ